NPDGYLVLRRPPRRLRVLQRNCRLLGAHVRGPKDAELGGGISWRVRSSVTRMVERSHSSRILTVHFALTLGGATQVAIDDAVALRSRGFDVGFASEPGVLEKDLDARAIRRHRLYCVDPERYPRWFRYLVGIPVTTILLFLYVLRSKYDCLYVQHRQSGIPSTVVSWITGA